MKAKEYLEKQEFNYDHFTKLTSTGISDDINNILKFAEDYHQAKLNLLTIPDVSQQRELFVAMFDKMTDDDIQECINGFAERVFNRLSNQ